MGAKNFRILVCRFVYQWHTIPQLVGLGVFFNSSDVQNAPAISNSLRQLDGAAATTVAASDLHAAL